MSSRELLRLNDFQCFEDREGRNRILFQVVSCLQCSLIYTNPWLTPQGARWLFEKAGASYGHCDPGERVDWVRRMVPEAKSVLDLGCGDGTFLSAFPREFETTGIEANAYLAEQGARQFPHVRFVQAGTEECEAFPKVQVITLFHFLEHVQDPIGLLSRLRRTASGLTRLVVEVPVLDRAIEVQGSDISGFFSIAHRTHFSRKTLNAVLSATGWRIEEEMDLKGNGYRVMATPVAPRSFEITGEERRRQLKMAEDYVHHRENSVEQIRRRIKALPSDCRLLIWGGGHHTEFLALLTDLFSPDRRFLIVDNDPLKSGVRFHGIPVCGPRDIPDNFWNDASLQILISSYTWQNAVVRDLKLLGVDPSRITLLYPDISG